MVRWLVLALFVMGCRPYIAAGYDASAHVNGPLATMMSARTTGSYSVAVGGGARDFTVQLAAQQHDAGAQEVAPSSSLDLAWTWLRLPHVSTNVHGGGAAMLLVDRMTGEHAVGQGFRYGAAVDIEASVFHVIVDYYRAGFLFGDGPATGFSDMTGVMVGLMVRR